MTSRMEKEFEFIGCLCLIMISAILQASASLMLPINQLKETLETETGSLVLVLGLAPNF